MKYTPHEYKRTFQTNLFSAEEIKIHVDLVIGHKSKKVGEMVYTNKTIEELTSTIALLL